MNDFNRQRIALICAFVYGAFVLIAVAPGYLVSWQLPQSTLMRIAAVAYTLTLLPAAVTGFFLKPASGIWLMFISALSVVALWMDEIMRFRTDGDVLSLFGGLGLVDTHCFHSRITWHKSPQIVTPRLHCRITG